ncbi:MAG: hypothetical protein KDB53_17180 [Planctomycetes bacterium]|nr:hypothetical protein [Planctomycetota bacterium]
MNRFHLLSIVLIFRISAQAQEPRPIVLGEGPHRYAWSLDWPRFEADFALGNTHGCIVVDHQGRIYVNTDTEHSVCIFEANGKLVGTWGKAFKGGLHGMTLVKEGDEEFLYLAHTGRHEVLKTTLGGEVIWSLGYPKESGHYEDENAFRPTAVAVAPNGDFYVADGYGRSWIHHYRKDRSYVRSFGGPGKEPGQLQTPHGIFCDQRGDTPVLIVADRENHRLQRFSVEGKHLSVHEGHLRRPCNVYPVGKDLAVADLAGRVTILDEKLDLVTHLGDQPDVALRARNGVPRDRWKNGEFLAPHSVAADRDGHLYVMDWNALGRVTKLVRLP